MEVGGAGWVGVERGVRPGRGLKRILRRLSGERNGWILISRPVEPPMGSGSGRKWESRVDTVDEALGERRGDLR